MVAPLAGVLAEIQALDGVKKGLKSLADDHDVGLIVPHSFRPALVAALFLKAKRPTIVVTASIARAEQLALEIGDYLGDKRVSVLPDWESYPFESIRPDVAAIGHRADIFQGFARAKPSILCLALTTLIQKVPPPVEKIYEPFVLGVGQEIDLHKLSARLVEIGYVKLPVVERAGEFAVRGSIVDIFPSQLPGPVRMDMFGDEIESVKTLSVSTQRSGREIDEVRVNPSQEFKLDAVAIARIMSAGAAPGGGSDAHRWLPLIYDLVPMTDYFPKESLFVIDEPKAVVDEGTRFYKEQHQALSEGFSGETQFDVDDYYLETKSLWSTLSPRLEMALVGTTAKQLSIAAHRQTQIAGQLDVLEKELTRLEAKKFRTVMVAGDKGERDRLIELTSDMGFESDGSRGVGKAGLSLVVGKTRNGFLLPDSGLAVFGNADIFPRREIESKTPVRSQRQGLIDFSDLAHGELIVHEIHGIASFAGLTRKTVGGKTREYLLLDYAAGDRLYLPTDQLHRVTRFVGPEDTKPPITRLGSPDWLRTTKKVKKSVKKLAIDLMALYAERSQAVGQAFSKDTQWQHELEAAFPYEATKDQSSAIIEVKKDMETPKPMDRLVCGDVGYGKTEVAIRAAFKAILDGKQVMMLVPTTILAQQHFLTFKERFAPYPVQVAMLSRFLTTGQQKEALAHLKAGRVDMIIGTHRLLQKDAQFKDLGLIIVDEEQRFGVNAKEKLRGLKHAVDVLTLSATPIPRTMQMSLSGVRDLSLIETPPEGRRPVITSIDEYKPIVVRSAIRRELARGGQVFYVHNRVETIEAVAAKVQKLVPEARIIVGHGKMTESSLESVMIKFLSKQADVLISTTIIESGIDIPSANTLIAENSDCFGLAQLHQLRGRVGRGHHRGYAYFTYRPGRILSDTAIERLKTIGEYTELGMGYKVALRDLEIRGAGDILGVQQHGQMISVGFDLYCQMLKKEVDSLQGKQVSEVPDVAIDLPVNAYLPQNYIEDENLRLEIYRTLAAAKSDSELDGVDQELADKFGPVPFPVANLLRVAALRLLAAANSITSVRLNKDRLIIKGLELDPAEINQSFDIKIKSATKEIVARVPLGQPDILEFVINFISAIIR